MLKTKGSRSERQSVPRFDTDQSRLEDRYQSAADELRIAIASHADQIRRTLDSPTTTEAGQMDNRKRTERRQQQLESWMEARRTYKPTSQEITTTEEKPPVSRTSEVELVEDKCYRNVPSLPPEIVMGILKYRSLDYLLFPAQLVNHMWNTLVLNQTGLLVANCVSMAKGGIPASLQFLYRGNISREICRLKPSLSTCNDQWAISMDFEALDPCMLGEYWYSCQYSLVREAEYPLKELEYPVVKRVELNLTESDSWELLGNSERRELKSRLCLRFEPGQDRQTYSAGNNRGSIWIECYWSKTVQEILNLKPLMSKDFGFKFEFVWKTRRGINDEHYYYTDHGSMSRIAGEEDIETGSLCIY